MNCLNRINIPCRDVTKEQPSSEWFDLSADRSSAAKPSTSPIMDEFIHLSNGSDQMTSDQISDGMRYTFISKLP